MARPPRHLSLIGLRRPIIDFCIGRRRWPGSCQHIFVNDPHKISITHACAVASLRAVEYSSRVEIVGN